MEFDMNESLIKDSLISITDKIYEDQYNELFPDIEPPVQELNELNVGDSIFTSDDFIFMTLQSYQVQAEYIGGIGYKPPTITDLAEDIRNEYICELDMMEEEGTIEEGTSVMFAMDESTVISPDIRPRIIEVLDTLDLTYVDIEYKKYFNQKMNKFEDITFNRIINGSTINLFDFDFKNVWIDRGSKKYEQSIREGYNSLLQINMGYL